jgi:hypothetical protein
MRLWLKTAIAATALSFAGAGAAQADTVAPAALPAASGAASLGLESTAAVNTGLLTVQHFGRRNCGHRPCGYRYGQHYGQRYGHRGGHYGYRHRGYQRPYNYGYYQQRRPYYSSRGHGYGYANNRCWRQERYSHYYGRPAYVSVRLCRDRYGRSYVQRGSEQLIYYVYDRQRHDAYRHHRYGSRYRY